MDNVELGRTGLTVGVAGLGCGGNSRLGQSQGASVQHSVRIVRGDLGVTYIDTAQVYGTEGIVGSALEGRRDDVVISTKVQVRPSGAPRLDAQSLRKALEESLGRLRTEVVDVFHLHSVLPADYAYCVSELVPELTTMRDRGVIRHLAISEIFQADTGHEMLQRAAVDGPWDVVMVGFNILNPSARTRVLLQTLAANVGVEVMFAVRNVFSQPEALRRTIADAVSRGFVDADVLDLEDPLGFLVHDDGASSVVEAAYRFARHEPGCHVVLTGTGNIDHLRSNVASINLPPLPEDDLAHLYRLFGHLAHFTGE